MQNLDTILSIWNSRNVTLFGKCLITKSLGISQLHVVHPLSTLDFLTQLLVQAVNSSIFKFIWKNQTNAKLWSKTRTKVVYVLQA